MLGTVVGALALTGCSSGSSTAAGTSAAGSSGSVAGSAAPPSPVPKPSVQPGGKNCSIIDVTAAAGLLGITPKQLPGAPSAGGESEDGVTVTKIDGCSYAGDPSLGYVVNRVEGAASPTQLIRGAQSALGAQPQAKPFDVGLGDASLGFTVATGPKTMARIEVASGANDIAVLVMASDPAKAKAVALAAAKTLVEAGG